MLLRKLVHFSPLIAVAVVLSSCGLPRVFINIAVVRKVTPVQQAQIAYLQTYGRLSNGAKLNYYQALETVVADPSIPTLAEVQALTASQKSQIEFLMTFGHYADGASPTYLQALPVVLSHPSVFTMAEYQQLVASGSDPPVVISTEVPLTTNQASRKNNNHYASAWIKWAHGIFGDAIGWKQQLSYWYNPVKNTIWDRSTKGYPFKTWQGVLWRYTGEYTSDGYPNWTSGGGGKHLAWISYSFIEMFEAGWGPISVTTQFNMVITGDSNGTISGGTF
jgi:hypothetical protein